jgi:HK97 family phage major capsid protein
VEELNDMADIAANSLSIAFGNFKEGYEIKDHVVGTRVLRDPVHRKPHVAFYTTKRVGGDVVNFQAIVLLKFLLAAVALLGHPHATPTANPPV